MKILERNEIIQVVGNCPHCCSKLELEKGDIWCYRDIDGCIYFYATCAVCRKGFDVENWKNINTIL